MPQSKTYFTSLTLENVRCFRDKLTLKLTDEEGNLARWTLLLGDNGTGKTTLLQCLAWMRPEIVKGEEASEGREFKKGTIAAAIQTEDNKDLERLRTIGSIPKFTMSGELFQGTDIEFGSPPKGKKIITKANYTFDKKGRLVSYQLRNIDISKSLNGSFQVPTIIAYGANRQLGFQNIQNQDLEDTLAVALSSGSELYDAEERLTQLNFAAKESQTKADGELLEAFKEALAQILPGVKNADNILIDPPRLVDGELLESRVRVRSGSELVPLTDLSLGFKTTAAWSLDLAWRLFRSNPKSKNPLREPAIVLIDELDLHLHPMWQGKIMSDLSEIFPACQFIATAHSPLMVQSMPRANFAIVRETEDGSVTIENTPEKIKGWRVDQILNSEYFDYPTARTSDAEALFAERSQLSNKLKRSPEENRRLRELQIQIHQLPVGEIEEDSKALELLRRTTEILERSTSPQK